MPASSQPSTVAMSRMPPPSWTGSSTAARIASTTLAPLTGRPGEGAVQVDQVQPFEAGLGEGAGLAGRVGLNTVAVSISPRSSRTAAPSFKSMAGKRITGRDQLDRGSPFSLRSLKK